MWSVVDIVQAFPLSITMLLSSQLGGIYGASHLLSLLIIMSDHETETGRIITAAVSTLLFVSDLFVTGSTATVIVDCVTGHQNGANMYTFGLQACHGADWDMGIIEVVVALFLVASLLLQLKQVNAVAAHSTGPIYIAIALQFGCALAFGYIAVINARAQHYVAAGIAFLACSSVFCTGGILAALPATDGNAWMRYTNTAVPVALSAMYALACASTAVAGLKDTSLWPSGATAAVSGAWALAALFMAVESMVAQFRTSWFRPDKVDMVIQASQIRGGQQYSKNLKI